MNAISCDMSTQPLHDPDGIPHVLIGISAVILVLLCAIILVFLSGHGSTTMVLALGVPAIVMLIVGAIHRRRHGELDDEDIEED